MGLGDGYRRSEMSADLRDLLIPALRAYADVSPSPTGSTDLVVARREDATMTATAAPLGFLPEELPRGDAPLVQTVLRRSVEQLGLTPVLELPLPRTPTVERLARLGALHADEQLLRHGWVVVVGTAQIEGERRRVLQPLISQPIRIRRQPGAQRTAGLLSSTGSAQMFVMSALGEVECTSLVDDPKQRADFVDTAEFGGGGLGMAGGAGIGPRRVSEELLRRMPKLTSWIKQVAHAAGIPVTRVLPGTEDPWEWIDREGLVAIAGDLLYLTREVHAPSLRNTLLNWAARPGIETSALAALLGAAASGAARDAPSTTRDPVESPLLLTPSQRTVVQRARSERTVVVSGPPGSGKTHTVCAVALDAIGRGQSVLIATQSRHAADVVSKQLHDCAGPEPVRFGSGTHRAALVEELTERQQRPPDASTAKALEREVETARVGVEALRRSISSALDVEAAASGAATWEQALPVLLDAAPAVFDPDSDLPRLRSLVEEARSLDGDGPLRRWSARRRRKQLLRLAGAGPGTSIDRIALAVDAATSRRASAELAVRGGTKVDGDWDRLLEAEDRLRAALARRLRVVGSGRRVADRHRHVAIAQLLTALRAGRARRRELLAEMDPGQLTAAASLWVGTLGEIEDVLPAKAGLFDVVILDEASQIDQTRAAPALLRARSAVVVGDPRQLRHVSFLSDADSDAALRAHGLEQWSALLDVRRVSAFDLAAAAAPTDMLREHFRSSPHLIDFSVRNFYRDRVHVMTRHPGNDTADSIDVVRVDAPSAGATVHVAEIDAVVDLVRKLAADGAASVGVVTPFRDQADALERTIAEQVDDEVISSLSLRVGTVHAFQGGERDVIIASLGLAPDDSASRRAFVERPDLFNVMVTRAKKRMVVVTSLAHEEGRADGLVASYLSHAERPLSPPHADSAVDEWPSRLAEALRRTGTTVREGYPVGPWRLDLCSGDDDATTYLECRVGPEGSDAAIEKRLTLMRLGWKTEDAYPSRWDGDAVRAAFELQRR